MSKKNIAKNTIKVLSDGKLKIKKGKKVDLTPYMDKSIANCIMGTIDGSGKRGRRPKDLELGVNNLLLSSPEVLRILSTTCTDSEYTIVDIVRLKDSITFDLTENSVRGEILRGSTLGGCYKSVKKKWLELNIPKVSDKTNFLYFPELVSFMNSDTGDVLKMPFKFNYLMISLPSMSRSGYDNKDVYLNNAVADIMDAIIEVGAKNVIIDPFAIKVFAENSDKVSNLFNTIISSDKVKNYLDTISFAIPYDDLFVTFIANQRNITSSNTDQFSRIKVTKENTDNNHIYDVKVDEDDDDDIQVVKTNVKKDGTLDIDAIVDDNDDEDDDEDDEE